MITILFLWVILHPVLLQAQGLQTFSIEGEVAHNETNITGRFLYTLRNDSPKPQKEWVFIINPFVNILSISDEHNVQAKIDIQHGINYRIITVNLSKNIAPEERTSLLINFSMGAQDPNPRFTITPRFVFLDARQFWFPYPTDTQQVDFQITVKNSSELHSVMGGKLLSDTTIIDQRFSLWQNELKDLSPSASLIITDALKKSQGDIHFYSHDPTLFSYIQQKFIPLWNTMKEKHHYFPISEIHIVPLALSLPDQENIGIEGEYLGNLFLINDQNILTNTDPWSSPAEQTAEILVHEFYHSLFPGMAKHDPKDNLFMESFVQFLTWDLINSWDPYWGTKIELKNRFFLQNFFLKKQSNHLWDYIKDSSLLFGGLLYSTLDGTSLADTIIEKYRFIEYNKMDVFQTIAQHQISSNTNDNNSEIPTSVFLTNDLNITQKNLFNSVLRSKKTNFNIIITNEKFFRRKKIVEFPVQATFLSVSHDYPFTWLGTLTWTHQDSTNKLIVQIPQNTVWETNLIGSIGDITLKSPFDVLDRQLYDNTIIKTNIYRSIVQLLNGLNISEPLNLTFSEQAQEKLLRIQQQDQKIIWDSSFDIGSDITLMNVYLIKDRKKEAYYTFSLLRKDSNSFFIQDIIEPQ